MKSLLSGLIPAIVAGLVGFATAYLAPSGAPAPTEHAEDGADGGDGDKHAEAPKKAEAKGHGEKKEKAGGGHGEKKAKPKGGHGEKGAAAATGDGSAYVNLEPLVVSLGPQAQSNYLKISISIETKPGFEPSIEALTPKYRDVLNTYLRAVDEEDLADAASMTKLRAQILRRIRIVSEELPVVDVLITDFILT